MEQLIYLSAFLLLASVIVLLRIWVLKDSRPKAVPKIPGRRYNFVDQEEKLDRLLKVQFDFYKNLNHNDKNEFVKRVIYFIHTSYFVPRNGINLTADMVSLFSSSFVQLTFGMPKKVLRHFNTVIIYPEKFYNSHTKHFHKGDVNLLGFISVSWSDFVKGYRNSNDGINLGLHELSHALSMEIFKYKNVYFDLFDNIKPIYVLAQKEISGKIPRNKFLREYAFTNIHEYFAVATENYFEREEDMRQNYNELYVKMKNFYNPRSL